MNYHLLRVVHWQLSIRAKQIGGRRNKEVLFSSCQLHISKSSRVSRFVFYLLFYINLVLRIRMIFTTWAVPLLHSIITPSFTFLFLTTTLVDNKAEVFLPFFLHCFSTCLFNREHPLNDEIVKTMEFWNDGTAPNLSHLLENRKIHISEQINQTKIVKQNI